MHPDTEREWRNASQRRWEAFCPHEWGQPLSLCIPTTVWRAVERSERRSAGQAEGQPLSQCRDCSVEAGEGWLAGAEDGFDVVGRQGAAGEIPLHVGALEGLHLGELRAALDTHGDHLGTE